MTGRSLPEWHAATLDTKIPQRVRLRVLERCEFKCGICTREIRSGDQWSIDHIKALINGGEHREKNMHSICGWCKPRKDREDVALKSDAYSIRSAHFGLKESKGPPMPGTKRSGLKKKLDGTVEKR